MQTSISKRFADCAPTAAAAVSFLIHDGLFELDTEDLGSPRIAVADTRPPLKRDTKSKGDISELRVATELTRAGYAVSNPSERISATT